MPPYRSAAKRTIEEIINAEDSNDEDYDDRAAGPAKPRSSRRRTGASSQVKKRPRRTYRGSDISDDEDDLVSEDEQPWTEEDEAEAIETNERGRPVRRTAKKAVTYEEPSDEDELVRSSSSSDSDREPKTPPATKARRTKIVRLKVSTPLPPISARSFRDRKSVSQQPASMEPSSRGTRHSRRLSHDEEEPVMQLSSSGRHVEVVRAGSREPVQALRPTRGGKGIKAPSKSTIDEEEEPPSFPREVEDDQLEIKASQHEVLEEEEEPEEDVEDATAAEPPRLPSDLPDAMQDEEVAGDDTVDPLALSQAVHTGDGNEEDEDEDMPVRRGRPARGKRKAESPPAEEPAPGRRKLRDRASAGRNTRRDIDQTSDFDPEEEAEEAEAMSEDSHSDASPQKSQRQDSQSTTGGRRSNRLRTKATSRAPSGSEDEAEELQEELAQLKRDAKERKKTARQEDIVFEPRRPRGGRKNYDLLRNMPQIEEDDEAPGPSPSQRPRKTGGGWQRRELLSTYGPFGGAVGRPVLGGPTRAGGEDSDSSDDEIMKQPKPVGGAVGMTPTTATPFNPFALQTLNSDAAQASAGTPANLGKIKDKQTLADADPLGVDMTVDFDSVGGLQGHIDRLQEMVRLPMLYPEVFLEKKITPPRGVLFHGPPGTGKTLLARALANSLSSSGRKVTFYMRKGADALSKWVGEAERQLRLLFEEARKNQPSIIFFDEIDGLAPVRSSKQEQIHASIVSTLLALMDGMDGRGQVIVIGATNRPDSIDPALRRPGRFDREFYFPLPDTKARRSIIQIHTKGWNPPLDENVKDQLAEMTKGYGGADLRALCTEAALNAVQRRYPQIYTSKEKLLIDPKSIHVMPKDFMISIKKMTPSSERSASSGASVLPSAIRPLLERPLAKIREILAETMPQEEKTTALEEAQWEDVADGGDFGRERMQEVFESTRIFRPRMLIYGKAGMGQQYVAAALLHHFQNVHVQSFDLAALLGDSASSPEATIVRLFAEVKTHKPSVIYIPNVNEWYDSVGPAVLTTFLGLLRSVKPTDPILVLGFAELDPDGTQTSFGARGETVKQDLFGYSKRNRYVLEEPHANERRAFFAPIEGYISTRPSDFPKPKFRNRRKLEILHPAPPEPEKPPPPPTKEELKAQKKRDRQTLNLLKIRLQPIMDQIRSRYKKFRTGVIDESSIRYLYEEADPDTLTTDLPSTALQVTDRPFEAGTDAHGVPVLVHTESKKVFYNLETVTIEKRLSNGYYRRPKDFLADIKRLAKDARTIEDEDRLIKAKELLTNVEVDVVNIETTEPGLTAECEKVYIREKERERAAAEKEREAQGGSIMPPPPATSDLNGSTSLLTGTTTTDGIGPVKFSLEFKDPKANLGRVFPVTPIRQTSNTSGMTNGVHLHSASRPSTGSGHEADAENPSHNTSHSKPSTGTHTSSSFGNRESAQPKPYWQHSAPTQQLMRESGMEAPLQQLDYVTPMQRDSQAADYVNEASTTQTTSGHKTSSNDTNVNGGIGAGMGGMSGMGGGGGGQGATQESGPNFYFFDEKSEGLPNTQGTRSSQQLTSISSQSQRFTTATARNPSSQSLEPSSAPAQLPPVPAFSTKPSLTSTNPLSAVLNPPSPTKSSIAVATTTTDLAQNLLLPTPASVTNTLAQIVDNTSGLSVEQLEQVNASLMDTLWRTRDVWDRREVLRALVGAFDAVMADMRDMGQVFADLSWNEPRGSRSRSRSRSRLTRRIEG